MNYILAEILPEINEEEIVFNQHYPERNYAKQENCQHTNFKLFFKCGCSLTLGENNLDEVLEILLREKERRRGREGVEVLLEG